MLINLNLKKNPYWYSVLISEGFFVNKSDKYDVLITDFTHNLNCVPNNKTVIIIDSSNLNILPKDIKHIKSIDYDISKFNFSYTNDQNQKVKVDIYKRKDVFFICYNFEIKLLDFQKQALKKIILDYDKEEFCYETLNKIDKNNIRKVLKSILRIAAKLLNKKLFYIWKYPSYYSNIFNFRIDVDPERNRTEKEAILNIKKTLNNFKNHSDYTTYAINFYRRHPNYETFLNLFNNNYDLVSHNYLHINFPTIQHSYKNINKSFNFLKNKNIFTNVFVSPEYFYYNNLNKIFKKLDIKFTSSLGFDYKSFPYRSVSNNILNSFIEIPYQPLVYSKFSQHKNYDIMHFYDKLINRIKHDESLTFLLYDHPNVLAKNPYIFDKILSLIDNLNLWKTTLSNFTSWLSNRELILQKIKITKNSNIIKNDYLNESNYTITLAVEDFEKNIIYLKKLNNEVNINLENSDKIEKKIKNFLDFKNIGDTINYKNERNINFINNYKHFKKIIMGYYLYYKLKVNL